MFVRIPLRALLPLAAMAIAALLGGCYYPYGYYGYYPYGYYGSQYPYGYYASSYPPESPTAVGRLGSP
jgi:hypothetical protein